MDFMGPNDRKLLTFAQAKDKYNLQDKDFLAYMQIRAQLSGHLAQTVIIPKPSNLEGDLQNIIRDKRKIISKIYKLLNGSQVNKWGGLQSIWERHFGITEY